MILPVTDTGLTEDDVLLGIEKGQISPVGDKVFALRCTRTNYRVVDGRKQYYIDVGDGKTLETTDLYGDLTNMATILAVGPRCKMITKDFIGWDARCPEYDPMMRRVVGEVWAIREEAIPYVQAD